eukprot:PITA_32884
MNEEYRSLLENDTWELVPLPKGRKLVKCKWVYRKKFGPNGKVYKHRAHLVAKGFSQVNNIDYTETFSPVTKMNYIFLVLSLAASFKWEVHQMDVKYAFLHGDLHEKIYMEQPLGFIQKDSNLVCQLKKSLYGLKQAPRACDPNLINHVKSNLKKKFEMIDLGHLHYFLGLQVLQSKEGISLSQSKYVCDLLRHFHMEDYKLAPSPFQSGAKLLVTCTYPEVGATLCCQLIGKLLYLTHTCPDLSFVVGLVTQFMQNPHESHWKENKRIIRYVRGRIQFGIHYSPKASPLLVGFIYFDCVDDPDDRKSTPSYVFTLGSRPITWACKKQSSITLSSIDAEYCGVIEASKEALWLPQILLEFGFQQQHLTTLWCDNQSVIQLCKNLVQHQHNKHIEIHMHFIRKFIHDHVLEAQYCPTDDQVAYIFTKALTEVKFTKLRFMVGVQENVTKEG